MRILVLAGLFLASGCARQAAPPAQGENVRIRFAIEVSPGTSGPVYVSMGGEGGPGWMWAAREGVAVHLTPRCSIPDCGSDPAVCGMSVPVVQDLTTRPDRRVEFVWDGQVSVVDSAADGQCEVRRPATPGTYVATFCYAREAHVRDAQSFLREATCIERPFNLGQSEVVLRL